MKCMLSGREMQAKLNPKLGPGDGTLTDFDGLPSREKPIVACAFRDFVLYHACLRDDSEVPGWLDLGRGVRPVLEAFGCRNDDDTVRAVHRVARDYYAFGVIYTKQPERSEIVVEDAKAFLDACLAADPQIGEFVLPGEDPERAVDFLARESALVAASRYDAPLDNAFTVQASFPGAVPSSSLVAPLKAAGILLSQALYRGFQEFKAYLDALIGPEEAGRWLDENAVEVYVRGSGFNLVPTRAGTPQWWSEGSR